MNLSQSPRSKELATRVRAFVSERVEPAEAAYQEEARAAAGPGFRSRVVAELQREARSRELWNLFYPDPADGPGLTNLEYAPIAELLGRSPIAPEATNSAAPDSGNMEILAHFGTAEQKRRWLRPLLDGEIRSAFAMTEPDVGSADARNVDLRIESSGDELILDGRKWWTSNALHPDCELIIVLGRTSPDGASVRRHSIVLVPADAVGLTRLRDLSVFGYTDPGGHAELSFDGVRIPADSMLGAEGDGFRIAQARLGPGRIHHCMRALGESERALSLLCRRASERITFGQPLASRANIQDWIAEARVEIEMARLLTLKAAAAIDAVGSKEARTTIAAIKLAAPQVALRVIDRAIQVHGGAGVSQDFPLARMYAHARTLRILDGPDEVHKATIARQELRRQAEG